MVNLNKIEVWPTRQIRKFMSRREYVDSNGSMFQGTQREALQHYRELYPSKSINLNYNLSLLKKV